MPQFNMDRSLTDSIYRLSRPVLHAERQAGRQQVPYFNLFWYDAASERTPTFRSQGDPSPTRRRRQSFSGIGKHKLKKILLEL